MYSFNETWKKCVSGQSVFTSSLTLIDFFYNFLIGVYNDVHYQAHIGA